MPQHQIIDKERDNSIDIARDIAIPGVLYGHAMAWQDIHGTMLVHWFWSFHMALFALVSGYFYKEKSFWESFVSSVKNLLVPLFVVSFVLFFMDKIGIQIARNLFHIHNAYILMFIFVLGCIVSTFILDRIRTHCSNLVLIN